MKAMPAQAIQETHAFADEARDAVYRAIFSRRDVRGQFLPTPVPDEVLPAHTSQTRLLAGDSFQLDHRPALPARWGRRARQRGDSRLCIHVVLARTARAFHVEKR